MALASGRRVSGLSFLLDISRLVSRLGTGPLTGIDRVELAWLDHLQNQPHLLLCRVPGGQVLLPAQAGALLRDWLTAVPDLPPPAIWHRLRGQDGVPLRAQRVLARMALHHAGRDGRGLADAARVQGADVYLNVGHANLTAPLLARLHGLRRLILIHDTIPLDYPQYTRPDQVGAFRERLRAAMTHADLLLTISNASRDRLLHWQAALNAPATPIITAPIGTTLTAPGPIPGDLHQPGPYFITLGTIEPRKNHALLLDVWAQLPNPPRLLILGRRGWENHATFARLDALPADGPIVERAGLDDATVAALIAGSHGLLMPSRAEGFGLPLTEAAGRGVPVVTAPLPSARELLGDYARYADPDDVATWAQTVADLSATPPTRQQSLAIPSWSGHFSCVKKYSH